MDKGIINQGAFFSPYYLFDLLGRQHADELDPEGREANRRPLRMVFRRAWQRYGENGSTRSEAWQAWLRELVAALGFGSTAMQADDALQQGNGILLHHVQEPVDTLHHGLVPISHAVMRVSPQSLSSLTPDPAPHGTGDEGSMKEWTTDPLLFLDVHGFGTDLERDGYAGAGKATPHQGGLVTDEPIARAIEFALDASETRWAIVTNGECMRLYRKGGSVARQYLEVNFPALFDGDRLEEWTAFWGLFRADAFILDPQSGKCLLDRVLEESQRHAARIADDLRENIVIAVETVNNYVTRNNRHDVKRNDVISDGEESLHHDDANNDALHHYDQTLYFLYRLLFVLYAESRDLLPVSDPVYRESYSFEHLREMAEKDLHAEDANKTYFIETLRTLFRMLREGFPPTGSTFAAPFTIPPYNGQLFDPQRTALIDQYDIPDHVMVQVVRELSLSRPTRRSQRRERYSYADLGVDQLGSIYEGLLVYEPTIVEEETVIARVKGEERLISRVQAEEYDLPIVEGSQRSPGSFMLRLWGGRRKGSGSYYTPQEITAFLIQEALAPIVEPIVQACGTAGTPGRSDAEAQRDVQEPEQAVSLPAGKTGDLQRSSTAASPEDILDIKVCDPAMGSGAFLIQACRYLAEAYGRARIAAGLDDDGRMSQAEFARYKRRVAETCLYGVDLNPMAVELAKVSLWLETLALDRPLTFLDAHLRCGNSLIGAPLRDSQGVFTVERISSIPDDALKELSKEATKAEKDAANKHIKRNREEMKRLQPQKAGQMLLPGRDWNVVFVREIEQALADTLGLRRSLESSDELLPAADAVQLVHQKAQQYADLLHGEQSRYRKVRLICDLWCATWFWGYDQTVPPPTTQMLLELAGSILGTDQGSLSSEQQQTYLATACAIANEQRFFHWELEFPEVWRDSSGKSKQHGGFDAVIGNPPWDKIKPNEREFYSNYDPMIWNYQGSSRKQFIARLQTDKFILDNWQKYEKNLNAVVRMLLESGLYVHQVAIVEGEKTGGDPDIYKFFIEKANQLLRFDGLSGIIAPFGIQGTQGCTALRRMLLDKCRLQILCKLDNERSIFPGVFHGQKFDLLVFAKGGLSQVIDAAFLSWENAEIVAIFRSHPRFLQIQAQLLRKLDPEQYTFLELKHQREIDLIQRIYEKFSRLGEEIEESWNVAFSCEMHMTNDSYLFQDGLRLQDFGAEEYPGRRWKTNSQSWYAMHADKYVWCERLVDSKGKFHLPKKLEDRKIRHHLSGYVLRSEANQLQIIPVLPDETYLPLYEGRMVHQFDHAAKAYVAGSGRSAKWRELPIEEKEIIPHYFVATQHCEEKDFRAGFCSVTGVSNERSLLTAIIPAHLPAGNSVPTMSATQKDIRIHLTWVAITNSFVVDWLVRLRVSNNINFFLLESLAIPRLKVNESLTQKLAIRAARLTCTTPEFAPLWDDVATHYPAEMDTPWQQEYAAIDPKERAKTRAEIDALVADLYGLSEQDFAYILTTFPLLDRDQPPLPGEQKSYITRDSALLELFKLRGKQPPDDIVAFFAAAGADISSSTGPVRRLHERVAQAVGMGAVGYLPKA
jgi:type I restriction-modification system DNA methylase subunit